MIASTGVVVKKLVQFCPVCHSASTPAAFVGRPAPGFARPLASGLAPPPAETAHAPPPAAANRSKTALARAGPVVRSPIAALYTGGPTLHINDHAESYDAENRTIIRSPHPSTETGPGSIRAVQQTDRSSLSLAKIILR